MKNTFIIALFLFSNLLFSQQKVSVVITDGNGSERLTELPSFTLNPEPLTDANLEIFKNEERQVIDGFGFALTQGSAETFASLSPEKQNELLNDFFNPVTGLNVSIIRISIGASDLSNSSYSYNDNDGDRDMSEFSLEGPDKEYLLPILKKILVINPDIKILATPWSAPKWMKTNQSWIGGSLKTSLMASYALYFRKYIEAMHAEGIDIWGITVQNEPEHGGNEPSMLMGQGQQIDFINNHLKGQIENLPFGTPKVIAFDHNCDNPEYAIAVANSSDFVDGSAFHLYIGDISTMSYVHDQTNKNVYFTEQYTSSGGGFDGQLGWHAERVIIGSLRNWSKTVIEWNISAYKNLTPRTPGGCTSCLGAVTVDNGNYTKNVSYYIIGQVSKFVDPGAKALKSTGSEQELDIAFRNPDGSNVLVVYNRNSNSNRDIRVNIGSQSFTYTIPSRAMVTFKWQNEKPEAPKGLLSTILDNNVELTWENSKKASSYDILRAEDANGPFSVIASEVENLSFTDNDLEYNTTYHYQIIAKNSIGSSPNSSTVDANIGAFIQIVPDGNYYIYSTVHGEAISTSNAPYYDVFMANPESLDLSQLWTLTHQKNNIYKIQNQITGYYMGVKGHWCGTSGELSASYLDTNDNLDFKISYSAPEKYIFQIAFTNCDESTSNDPVKAWEITDGALGGMLQTNNKDLQNPNQQFILSKTIPEGINDYSSLKNNFIVFPSPANDLVYVTDLNTNKINGELSILDAQGRILKTVPTLASSENYTIDLSELSNGVYFLRILQGSNFVTKKMVIAKK